MKEALLTDGVVSFRAMEPEDLELLYTIENDSGIWDEGTVLVPYSKYALHHFLQTTRNDLYVDRQLRLMVTLSASGHVVGIIDLFHFEPHHSRAEIGITLLASCRGKGLALRAVELLCRYAYKVLHLHSLSAWVAHDNTGSRRLFEKAGFQERGELKDWLMTSDGYKDVIIFQKLLNK